jgi:hypothetical protein
MKFFKEDVEAFVKNKPSCKPCVGDKGVIDKVDPCVVQQRDPSPTLVPRDVEDVVCCCQRRVAAVRHVLSRIRRLGGIENWLGIKATEISGLPCAAISNRSRSNKSGIKDVSEQSTVQTFDKSCFVSLAIFVFLMHLGSAETQRVG